MKEQARNQSSNRAQTIPERTAVRKTYKLYINGAFPRTESGRFYDVKLPTGEFVSSICLASRKDLRNAVSAARSACLPWQRRSSFNKGQILYRIAEMLEARREQLQTELERVGTESTEANQELDLAIDRLVYYAGWSDKYQQILSSVNPVSSAHFNFSVLEPMGVVGILAPEESSFVGFVSLLAPVIAGGNTCVVLASESRPLPALSFAEVLNDSDVPAGVVNILSGSRHELLPHFYSHRDVNALADATDAALLPQEVAEMVSTNFKRVRRFNGTQWHHERAQSPYHISDFQEVKTTWHPIGTQG